MVTTEQEQENKKLLRITELAGKKMWLSSLIGSISGGLGSYLYCGRYLNIFTGLFLSMMIGCVAVPREKYCEQTPYGESCPLNIAPIFILVAIIDNVIAISKAREKLKDLESEEALPDNPDALKLNLLKLVQERGEATVRELSIITGYSEKVVRNALCELEWEQLIRITNREEETIIYPVI